MQKRNDRARTKLTQEIDKTLHSTEQTASVRKPGIIWLEKEKKKGNLERKKRGGWRIELYSRPYTNSIYDPLVICQYN